MAECDTAGYHVKYHVTSMLKGMDVDKAVTRAGAALSWETLKEK